MLISSTYRQATTGHVTLPLVPSRHGLQRPDPEAFETLVIQYNADT